MPPEPTPSGRSCLPITLAALLGFLVLVVLTLLTGGAFGFLAAVGAVVFCLALLHYLIWGWWLSKLIRREVEDDEERERRESS